MIQFDDGDDFVAGFKVAVLAELFVFVVILLFLHLWGIV
jgi:hypothetical protein